MKKNILTIITAIFGIYLFLVLIFGIFGFFGKSYISENPLEENNISENEDNTDSTVEITLKRNSAVEKMKLNTYLYGVVAAEMPASFETEALKAQAVCARSYAYRQIMQNGYAVERRIKHNKLRRQARRGEIAVRRI